MNKQTNIFNGEIGFHPQSRFKIVLKYGPVNFIKVTRPK